MPYLTEDQKQEIDEGRVPETEGELNYKLTACLIEFLMAKDSFSYADLNQVDGALGLCQAEFRRRIVYPYENLKVEQNGDVYDDLQLDLGLDVDAPKPFRG